MKVDCDYCFAEGKIFDSKKFITCPKCKGEKKIEEVLLNVITEFDSKIYGRKKVR